MTTTPPKETQLAEALTREQAGTAIPPGETASALESGEGASPQDPLAGAPPQNPPAPADEPTERPAPKVGSFGDDKRAGITARFRTARTVATEEGQDELSDFTRSGGMPAEFREAAGLPVEEEAAQPEPQAAPAPAVVPAAAPTLKLKVHGKDIELPVDQVVAQAQRALASDDILEEAKSKNRQLDAILEDARQRSGQRAAPGGINQTDQNSTRTTEPAPAAPNESPDQDDTFGAVIESIQFGDPKDGGRLLRETIGKEAARIATPIAQQAIAQARLQDEDKRGANVLKDFKDQHPDLVNDPMASAAIERKVLDLQLEDFATVGLDLSKVLNGRPATAADIAQVHRWLRTEGQPVRSPETMLVTARDAFLQWKGVKQEPVVPTPPPSATAQLQQQPPGTPRVTMSVVREQRRETIQPQPSRTTNPGTTAQQPAPQTRDRSDVVTAMQKRMASRRGTNLGLQ